MALEFPEITEELAQGEGQILSAWFTASLMGPAAVSIGYVEQQDRYDLFYAHHHYSEFRGWLIGSYKRQEEYSDAAWGEALLSALVRLRTAGLLPLREDYGFHAKLPDVLVTNGNPYVLDAFEEVTTIVNAGRDWAIDLFLINRYGPNLIRKARWLARWQAEFEGQKQDTNTALVASLHQIHGSKSGFDEWAMPDLPPTYTTRSLVRQWAEIVSEPRYVEQALWRISQMWAMMPDWAPRRDPNAVAEHGTRISFRRMADFFERYRLPLWPSRFDDMTARLDARLNEE